MPRLSDRNIRTRLKLANLAACGADRTVVRPRRGPEIVPKGAGPVDDKASGMKLEQARVGAPDPLRRPSCIQSVATSSDASASGAAAP